MSGTCPKISLLFLSLIMSLIINHLLPYVNLCYIFWCFLQGFCSTTTVSLPESLLFVSTLDGNLHAVSKKSGSIKWTLKEGKKPTQGFVTVPRGLKKPWCCQSCAPAYLYCICVHLVGLSNMTRGQTTLPQDKLGNTLWAVLFGLTAGYILTGPGAKQCVIKLTMGKVKQLCSSISCITVPGLWLPCATC